MRDFLEAHHGWVVFGSVAMSVAIHGSAVFLGDDAAALLAGRHAAHIRQSAVVQTQENLLDLQFVESRTSGYPEKPEKNKRMSDKDSLSQDLTTDKTNAKDVPYVKEIGPGDQLAQRRGGAASQAAQASQAQLPQAAIPAVSPASPAQETLAEIARMPQASAPEEAKPEVVKEARMTEFQTADTEKIHDYTTAQAPAEARPPASPSMAQAASMGSSGGDKINAQEMAHQASGGAKLFGQTSFEATGSGMGEYMKKLKEKIWLAWFPYIAFQYPQDFQAADAILSITLDSKGNVKIVRVLESKGSEVFASFCMEAVQKAGNFGALPDEILALLGKEELEIRFGFHFHT